jgi:hypothetical protein
VNTRTLLNRIIKARQLLCQDGAPADGLSVRLHPADAMTLGLEAQVGGLVHVDQGGALSILHMPFVEDVDVAIGAPVVEHAKKKPDA